MTHTPYSHLQDEELLRFAVPQTPLECALYDRFARMIGERARADAAEDETTEDPTPALRAAGI